MKREKRESMGSSGRLEKVTDRKGSKRDIKSYSSNDVVAMETLSSVRLLHRCHKGIFKRALRIGGGL